jgi:ribosome-associated protein
VAEAERGLWVAPGVVIPEEELVVRTLRAGGPGGQNVNKVSSGVLLRFDLGASRALDEEQRRWLAQRLASRLTRSGEILIRAVEHREQERNRRAALERLRELLAQALARPRPRLRTRPTRASQRRRLASKRAAGERKASRRRPAAGGDG